MSSFPFESLRRWPDLESPELVAVDAADRLLLTELQHAVEIDPTLLAGPLSIIGDTHGALTLGALAEAEFAEVLVHQDARSGELALMNNAKQLSDFYPPSSTFQNLPLSSELVDSSRIVVLRLPRSLEQLEQWAALIATHAADDVLVLAGGRIKHMTLSMNETLGKFFTQVEASLAEQKSRVLRARGPKKQAALDALTTWPKSEYHADVDLTVCAQGGAFAGISIDIGTYDLLAVLDRVSGRQGMRIIDFGCGTGVLAAQIAKLRPTATVIASDQSAAAVESAKATMAANNLSDRVTVVRDDGLSSQEDSSADLILFNPPFHSGAAVHAGTSLRLFAEAGRVLKPGGELWVVANRHLSYKPALRKLVGETREVRRTPKFTVTKSVKP
ncbi:class I SAM-dependent methyltransferase [Aurantimicrobium sp. MWH-Uga1]|uniref:class I SAM-dependent methyltransferase n=1 Tax=Aurantimicrobium sp. MWH-Uga1 TaxID=2079575 RepID=UPI000DED54CB|nr:class I SAM-dependent methyltransferase [Aurantimicrobium sp. MWH-Uga1]AXE55246.1 Ribosomal RNA large subunit methyltransferase G [Aurantimicrobium sp. MWH-Uga1]